MGEARAHCMVGAHHDWHRGRMPVVRMNHVGTNEAGGDGGGSAKEYVAAQIVRIIAPVLAVNAVTREESRMVNQVERHIRKRIGAQQSERLLVRSESDTQVCGDHANARSSQEGSVAWQDDAG